VHQNIVTTKMIMGITDKQAQIAEMLQQKDFLNVEELAEYFQVTTQTIRRDLNVFCDRGIVRYRHRGVERHASVGNDSYTWRQSGADGAE